VKNLDFARIARVVAETLRRDFENIRIIDVKAALDHDRDGDEILRIEVIFDGRLKNKDAKHLAGAVRRLRPALEGADADLFPLLSFVSRTDYERGLSRGEAR